MSQRGPFGCNPDRVRALAVTSAARAQSAYDLDPNLYFQYKQPGEPYDNFMRDVGKNYKLLEGGTGDAILLYNLTGPYAGIMDARLGALYSGDRERDRKDYVAIVMNKDLILQKLAHSGQTKFIQYDTRPPTSAARANGSPTPRLSSIPALDGILTQQRTGRLGRSDHGHSRAKARTAASICRVRALRSVPGANWHGRAPCHHDVDRPAGEDGHKMGREVGVAGPGYRRHGGPPDRQAAATHIADGERLDDRRLALGSEPLRAAPISAERNGRIRIPSPVVPSANSSIASPAASRAPIRAVAAPVSWRRARSMKTLRCRRAKSPITGHAATSLLAMKERGASEPMTGMSSQETWLATISSGRRGPWRRAGRPSRR